MKIYQQFPNSASSYFFSYLLTTILYLSFIPTIISASLIDSCPIAGQLPCGSGTPSGFCCSQGQKCIVVAGNTTAICCPAGKTCSSIIPISCNIKEQNVTANPLNAIKTIALNSSMIKCGTRCCPFGFSCNSVGVCVMNADQSSVPSLFFPRIINPPNITTASVASVSPQPTALSLTTPSTTFPTTLSTTLPTTLSTTSSPSLTTSVMTPVSGERFKQNLSPISILVGLFPGLLGGILLVVVLLYSRKIYKKRKKEKNGTLPQIKHISAPRPIDDVRTDFLRMHEPQNSTMFTEASYSEKNSGPSQNISIFKMPSHSSLDLDEALMAPLPPPPLHIRKNAPAIPLEQSNEFDSEYMNRFLTVSYSSERTPIMRTASVRDFRYFPEDFEDYRKNSFLGDKSRYLRECDLSSKSYRSIPNDSEGSESNDKISENRPERSMVTWT